MEHQVKAPPEIQKVAQFLRGGGSGLKNRVGALNGKRLDYFKGALFHCRFFIRHT
jgi:translocation protein SEC62